MNSTYRISTLALSSLGALALSACQGGHEPTHDFISDDPNASGDDYGEDGLDTGDPAGESGGDEGGDNGDGDVDISEADIVQLEGDVLYALSSYAGLTVVDVQDPDDMRALGTWETDAQPFEMYVDSAQAFVMFNDYGFWDWDEDLDEWSYLSSSRLVALDASDPADIEVRGEFTLPGRIQDSRRVGDVLYLVTMEDGYCWSCSGEQKTVVTSLDISNQVNPQIVDQIAFYADDDNWDWQRSVESTSERMYVAARTWAWEGMGSYIDVVDISAGDGTLSAGDRVQVTGSVFSRWQMDEHAGVLRVISQLGWGDDPVIETFTIESADSIVPLGSGNLSLPTPESLRSARFDGEHAYAITAEQTDPLYTIDLSDPANPKQQGELEIPGWVYHMETRDDRVLALGFDPSHPDGSINVSLFDVSVFDSPTLRRRVHFGGDWADFAEDQNRIHKAFSILDDEQMILVPHTGWDWDEGQYECPGTYRSGVQIIDWADDDLTLRGLVPARGRARRAFTHRQRILTLSDVELASFDYADRDAPQPRDDLSVAVHVDDLVFADGVWVRMARDWYTSEQLLEIVDPADPGAAEPLGVIDLGDYDGTGCEWSYVDGLFAGDGHVFVVQSVNQNYWEGNQNFYASFSRVLSVDISDPTNPVLDDVFELPGERAYGVGQLAGVSTTSSWFAHHGDHLAVLMQDDYDAPVQVHVIDLSDPSQLELRATLARPEGQTQGQLAVLSDTIVSWHTEPVDGQPGKVRFYFDRLDLDGEPSWTTKINVPGVIVAYDADAGTAYTVDFQITPVELDESACWAHPKHWRYDWDTHKCTLISRTLERLDIEGNSATLVETIDIEGDAGLEQLLVTQTRIFAKTDKTVWSDFDELDGNPAYDTELVIVDLAAEGALERVDGEDFGQWWWLTAVEDERAVMQANYGQVVLVDAGDIAQPEVLTSSLPGWGGCYNPVIDGDTVYCPMGPYGLGKVQW